MAAAVKAKFGEKISSWIELNIRNAPSKSCRANLNPMAFQSFEVHAYKSEAEKKGKLKGSADARAEQGWAFSLTLVDRGVRDFVPEQPMPEDEEAPEGVDAL